MIDKFFIQAIFIFSFLLYSCASSCESKISEDKSNLIHNDKTLNGRYIVQDSGYSYDLNLVQVKANMFFYTLHTNLLNEDIMDNFCGILERDDDTLFVKTGGISFNDRKNFGFKIVGDGNVKIFFNDFEYVREHRLSQINNYFKKISDEPNLDLKPIIFSSYIDINYLKSNKKCAIDIYEFPVRGSKKNTLSVRPADTIYSSIRLDTLLNDVGKKSLSVVYIKIVTIKNTTHYGWLFADSLNIKYFNYVIDENKSYKSQITNSEHIEYKKAKIKAKDW
jgi:hypothetical protein